MAVCGVFYASYGHDAGVLDTIRNASVQANKWKEI